uniref:Sea24 n=1 Tax=Klebsiella pneumoniae TaxID=573 RepID=A0A8B0ST91_KLEPN|nr:Sea24 [Klebsiella pneumoniae]
MNRFRESGAAGLANLRRGRPGNHRLPESLKLRVLSLLHDHYSDFGPTLAAEKNCANAITSRCLLKH